jgi:hypothetical protein
MARYLLDTNHLSAALDDRSTIRGRLYQSRQAPFSCDRSASGPWSR